MPILPMSGKREGLLCFDFTSRKLQNKGLITKKEMILLKTIHKGKVRGKMRYLFALAALYMGTAVAYPDKPIHMIVPQAAGGGSDTIARFMAEKMGAELGQPIVVENRPGGGGLLGAEVAKRGKPDGYTLMLGTIDTITSPLVSGRDDFDPVKDFVAVTKLSESPNVWAVGKSFNATTMTDFVNIARENPGKIDFASAGVGTTQHLGGELLAQRLNIELGHVPYKGGPPGFVDVLGGRIPVILSGIQGALPHVKSDSVVALAVTSRERAPALPDVPTVEEALDLPGYEAVNWQGLFFPAGTPADIVDKIAATASSILQQDETREKLASMGYVAVGTTPEDFTALVKREQTVWKEVIDAAGIKVEF